MKLLVVVALLLTVAATVQLTTADDVPSDITAKCVLEANSNGGGCDAYNQCCVNQCANRAGTDRRNCQVEGTRIIAADQCRCGVAAVTAYAGLVILMVMMARRFSL